MKYTFEIEIPEPSNGILCEQCALYSGQNNIQNGFTARCALQCGAFSTTQDHIGIMRSVRSNCPLKLNGERIIG